MLETRKPRRGKATQARVEPFFFWQFIEPYRQWVRCTHCANHLAPPMANKVRT